MAHATSLNLNANLIRAGILERSANLSEDPGLADFNCSVRSAHDDPQCDGYTCCVTSRIASSDSRRGSAGACPTPRLSSARTSGGAANRLLTLRAKLHPES